MATPRKVASLNRLVAQIDALFPKRSKLSDGWIGDTAHSARKSDHNPDADGTVDARDITHDPKNGVDIANLVNVLIAGKDRRISYIIANSQIISGNGGPKPWVRRKYSGSNKHTKHIHISVLDKYQDDASDWNLSGLAAITEKQMLLKLGATGPAVKELQSQLNTLGFGPLVTDGDFGDGTDAAVRRFQLAKSLNVDGVAGPRTMKAIGEALQVKEMQPKLDEAKKNIPPTADKAVKEETTWFNKVIGWFTGGGLLTAFGLGNWSDADWTTILAMAGGVVLVGGAAVGGFLLLGNRVAAKFDEINARARQ